MTRQLVAVSMAPLRWECALFIADPALPDDGRLPLPAIAPTATDDANVHGRTIPTPLPVNLLQRVSRQIFR